jgi:transposase
MYIRKTAKTDPKTGILYTAYHLVESVRTERGPRQRVLLYMGSQIDLPEEDHKLLAQRIEEIITGQPSLIPYPEPIERLAEFYAAQVIRRLAEPKGETQDEKEEFVSVNLNSIEHSEPRTVGAEHLLLQMAHQLELPVTLKDLGFSETDTALAIGSIIARAVNPDSERSTFQWLCNKSGMGELLDFEFSKSSLDKLYLISDKLLKQKVLLETSLAKIETKNYSLQNSIALYDLTNTYMEGHAKSNSKAKHGVSKEKRSDCPLITMGLVMNESGFLNRTSFLPGNASEPKTLKGMIEALGANQSLIKPVIVLDSGISTEENLKWLRDNGYKYVVSARQDAPTLELEGEMVAVGDLNGQVKAALIKGDADEEKWLYCESEAKAAVASEMKRAFKKRFEDDLQEFSTGLLKPKSRKKYIKVIERLGRLKEKHKRISSCYEIEVMPSEDGHSAIGITWKVLEEKMSEKLKGSYFLRTNLTDIEPKELWQLYNTLRGIEDAFRFMKSSLGLRPIFHQKERRVDGHLWITVLAYHLIQSCLYQLGKQGIRHNWKTILEIMRGRVRVTTQAKTIDGKILYYRSSTKAEGRQLEIYRALGLSPQILKARKTVL